MQRGNSIDHMKIALLVDDLRIGGIQRLCLDQAYYLSDIGIDCEIWVYSKFDEDLESLENQEVDLISSKLIKIIHLSGRRREQGIETIKLLRVGSFDNIIAHSLRGSVISYLARPLIFKKYKILLTIHQLPSLSNFTQKFKRMFYSQFTDKLFIYSLAALNDWEKARRESLILRIISWKKTPVLCRNGVYLNRLPILRPRVSPNSEVKRLIFLGRLTSWKGLEVFLRMSKINDLDDLKFLIISPTSPQKIISEVSNIDFEKFEQIIGKSLTNIELCHSDLHIFPVNHQNEFIESVSINVLEMSVLGIFSLVTKGGMYTWPELIELGIVKEVDWNNNAEIVTEIFRLKGIKQSETILKIRELISIENNIKKLLSL